MILAYAIILLVIFVLLLRRDLSKIGQIPIRGGYKLVPVVVGLFVIQAVLVLYVPGQTLIQAATLVLSQSALVLLFLSNHRLPGAKLFACGIILNVTVMLTNGGWMPISPETYQFVHPERTVELGSRPPTSKNIVLPRAETNLWLLSDMVPVVLPWRRTAVSIGDILLVVAAAQFIFQTTSPKERDLKERDLYGGPIKVGTNSRE